MQDLRTLLYIACYNGHGRLATVSEPASDLVPPPNCFSFQSFSCVSPLTGWLIVTVGVTSSTLDFAAPTVRLLLAHGASVTSYTPSGKSVLSTAVANGNVDVVKLLLQQPNCDPNHQDNAGTVPLMLAAEVTRPAGVSVQLVQMLLGQLPDFQPAIVADVTIRDFSHQTALDRCFRCNADPRVAQALVKAGAKVVEHCEYASGGHHYATTSLMNAAMNGLTKVVEWLLFDIGVDPFAKTAHGLDARAFAEGKGHAEIVAMLEKRMSK